MRAVGIVTASRVLRVGFGHAMDAVGFSESAPPFYYALAWLDRWLRRRPAADRRLLAGTFDGSVDDSAIGLGHWDPLTQQNQPHRLRGRAVRDALSRYYASRADLGAVSCPDLRRPTTCHHRR